MLQPLLFFIKHCLAPGCCAVCHRLGALLCTSCHAHIVNYDNQHPSDYYRALYAAPLSQLITQLKFSHQLQLIPTLSHLFLENIRWVEKPDIIVPIPLHKTRLRERGFNQSLELAKPIAKALRIPIDTQILFKIKNTQPQSELSAKARHRNIAGSFSVEKSVTGKHIVLFDDVITTGTTLQTAKTLLMKKGARRVSLWALARTPL